MNNPLQDTLYEEMETTDEATSSRVMLVTMLLLIAGLLLSSAMMVYHAFGKAKDQPESQPLSEKMLALKTRFEKEQPAPHEPAAIAAAPATPAPKQSRLSLSRLIPGSGWPRLKLIGFGSSVSGEENFAIINGEQVRPGGMVNGVKVVEIRSSDVVVEYQGEQKTLTVDLDN